MTQKYNPRDFEERWRKEWEEENIHKTPTLKANEEKFYSLYSFPYPSGAGLHVGHVEGMVANDIAARFHRMKGDAVTLPMGWDSFGLPAENYAIKTGVHPHDSTEAAVKTFIDQIKKVGISVDWEKEVGAHRPSYYRWTQWIFLQLYKAGLAYQKFAPVNWCPNCQTALANEQVVNGRCERCDTEVVQKEMNQWFFKITEFADRLDKDLDSVDWPESTKLQQRNWIGRSEGAKVKFKIQNSKSKKDDYIQVFTTRPDTIFGATFLVVSPEHELVRNYKLEIKNYQEVEAYVDSAKQKTELERQQQKEKTGIKIEGITAINPLTDEEIPIFVADYVLKGYGTGAIMAVPAHDERDFEFAKKYNLPIKQVIVPPNVDIDRIERVVAELISLNFNDEKKFWIMGGIRSAALAGFFFRTPYDIDIMVEDEDLGSWEGRLGKIGYARKSKDDLVFKRKYESEGDPEIEVMLKSEYMRDYSLSENDFTEVELWGVKLKTIKSEKVIEIREKQYKEDPKPHILEDLEYLKGRIISEHGVLVNSENIDDKKKNDNKHYTIVSKSVLENYDELKKSLDEKSPFYNVFGNWQGIDYFEFEDYLIVASMEPMSTQDWLDLLQKHVKKDYKSTNIIVIYEGKIFEFQAHDLITLLEEPKSHEEIETKYQITEESFVKDYDCVIKFIQENSPYQQIKALSSKDELRLYNGLSSEESKEKIIKWLEKKDLGKKEVNFKLRDWLVSRQRYWGAPIPIMYKELGDEEKTLNDTYQSNPDLVIDIHAWGSNSKKHYHDWLHKKLEQNDIEVNALDLPNSEKPDLFEWIKAIESKSTNISPNTVITARSLGCWAALKLAESHKIRKLVLLAPTCPIPEQYKAWSDNADTETVEILKKFVGSETNGNVDFEKVKNNVGEIQIYLSTNDPYINLEKTKQFLKEKLGLVYFTEFKNALHFSDEAGFSEFNELYDEILKPVNLGIKPIPEEDLPVILPYNVDFKPTGESPLKYSEEFHKGIEDKYGKGWRRETDTMDTFVCSSWYYFRFLAPKNEQWFTDPETVNTWLPVDLYMIGTEHIVLHLLYSRFFTKFFADQDYIKFNEPFYKMRHMGTILGPDGRKMSKRWGNVINPSDEVETFGADALRMYEMFMGPLEEAKAWNTSGEQGIFRFLSKVWNLQEKVIETRLIASPQIGSPQIASVQQEKEINKLIKKVGEDIESLSFNTAIAKMMEFVNFVGKEQNISRAIWEKFLLVLAPFAPFISEELWGRLGNEFSIHTQKWPQVDISKIVEETVKLAVQVNGKVRATIEVPFDSNKDFVVTEALKVENVKKYVAGDPKKVIYVKNKILNLIV